MGFTTTGNVPSPTNPTDGSPSALGDLGQWTVTLPTLAATQQNYIADQIAPADPATQAAGDTNIVMGATPTLQQPNSSDPAAYMALAQAFAFFFSAISSQTETSLSNIYNLQQAGNAQSTNIEASTQQEIQQTQTQINQYNAMEAEQQNLQGIMNIVMIVCIVTAVFSIALIVCAPVLAAALFTTEAVVEATEATAAASVTSTLASSGTDVVADITLEEAAELGTESVVDEGAEAIPEEIAETAASAPEEIDSPATLELEGVTTEETSTDAADAAAVPKNPPGVVTQVWKPFWINSGIQLTFRQSTVTAIKSVASVFLIVSLIPDVYTGALQIQLSNLQNQYAAMQQQTASLQSAQSLEQAIYQAIQDGIQSWEDYLSGSVQMSGTMVNTFGDMMGAINASSRASASAA